MRIRLSILITLLVLTVGTYYLYSVYDNSSVEQSSYTTVTVFHYNATHDIDNTGIIGCSPDSVLPLKRIIPKSTSTEATSTEHIARAAIEELLTGNLTVDEKAAGFTTEFPNPEFKILDFYVNGATATVTFSQVPGFTTGGACRVGIIRTEIEKTLLEVPGIDAAVILPEDILQP